jgi:hypothetical protein
MQRGVGKVQPSPQTSPSAGGGRPGALWAPSHHRQKRRFLEGHPEGTRGLQTARLRKSYNRENNVQKSKAYFITTLIPFWRVT